MLEGVLIAESLRKALDMGDIPLTITRIDRVNVTDAVGEQPPVWTLLTFAFPDEHAELLAERLQHALSAPGWYVDFRTSTDVFVVFPDQIFRYPRGSAQGRSEAVTHGRTCGVPDSQLDWGDERVRR